MKKVIYTGIFLLGFYTSCFSATLKLTWDHTVIESETPPKFRIYSKLKSAAEYNYAAAPLWDSKTTSNPTGVREAIVTVPDGNEYNFIARSYIEGQDENGVAITIESVDSNEVVFNAPVFALTGVVLSSFANSETYIGTVYYGNTGVDIRMSWAALYGVDEYEFKLYDIHKKYNVISGKTTNSYSTFKLPKAGTFEFSVRARRGTEYTEWNKLNARIQGLVSKPGSITIN